MKTAIIILSVTYLLICQLACSKNNADDIRNANLNSELSFDIDGKHIKFSGQAVGLSPGVRVTKISRANAATPLYVFQGIKDSINFVTVEVYADSLTTKSYELTQGITAITVNGDQYKNGPVDRLTMTISSYQNGIVNGSFNGTLSRPVALNTLQRVTISNGVLKDIRVSF